MAIETNFDARRTLEDLDRDARQILNDAVSHGQEVAQREASVDKGALRRDVRIVPTPEGANLESEEPYSVFVEFGTGVYDERGGGRQTPWVYTPDNGRHFYVTSGMHPRPFMRPGYQAAKRYLETEGRKRFGK